MAHSRRSMGHRIAVSLTAAFMLVATTLPGGGADVCAQNLTQETVKTETGYSNLSDVQLSAAYARFMENEGRNPEVLRAIMDASEQTGVPFELMVVKAILESSLGKYDEPIHIQGGARGLYQFLPPTWLTLFSWFGAEYENGKYKDLVKAIEFDRKGVPYVLDKDLEKQILALRSDHHVASFIKAMQVKNEEQPFLTRMLGREPKLTDYYIVHFLGIPRAQVFYRNLEKRPNAPAARTMSKEARYNRHVFYEGRRKSRTFKQVYDRLERIINERLDEFRTVSKDILASEQCAPAFQRVAPPIPAINPRSTETPDDSSPKPETPEEDAPQEKTPETGAPETAPGFNLKFW